MVLWELLTHLKPFDGFGHFKVATKIVNGEVSLVRHVQVHNSIHHKLVFCSVRIFLHMQRHAIHPTPNLVPLSLAVMCIVNMVLLNT